MISPPHAFCLLSLCWFLWPQTEYEVAVGPYVEELAEGGCHNPQSNPDSPVQRDVHDHLTSRYGWPILTRDAVSRVADFIAPDGVIDFGAGTGYFAYLLAQRGIDAVAIDDWSGGKPEKLWHKVQSGGVEALPGTADRVLLLSWPPRLSPMAIMALEQWGGTRLIYAGEILRRTADPSFHRELARNWRLVERVTIPQWRNFSDAIYLFERQHGKGVGAKWMLEERDRGCTFGPDYLINAEEGSN